MKIININLVFLGLLCLLFINCGSIEDPIECPPQFTGDLEDFETKLIGKWVASAVTSDIEVDLTNDNVNNPSLDMFEQYDDCSKDAIFRFDENRLYSYDTGSEALNCTKTSTVGTWKLNNNTLYLIISCSSINYSLTFNEDNSQFEYKSDVSVQEVNGLLTSARVTFTFTKAEN